MPDLLQQALQYATLGWRVLPLHDFSQGQCSCKGRTRGCKPGKHPRISEWQNRATTDPAQIRAWWTKWPHANIGICTGHTSGIVVVDIDDVKQVPTLVKKLGLGELYFLDTMTVQTGSGGYHIYFQTNLQLTKNNTGVILPGVDFIAEGGYVIAPPSVTSKGAYSILDPTAGPASIPAKLLSYVQAKGQASSPNQVLAPHTTGLGFPKRTPASSQCTKQYFAWGKLDFERVTGLTNDMIHRFPVIQNGEHSNRDDQTIRMVGYLLVVGHSPATTKAVGTDWLTHFQDKYKTPLAHAVILLEEKIKRTYRDIQQEKLTKHTEHEWVERIRNQGFSYRLAGLSTKKPSTLHTTGLGFPQTHLSGRETALTQAIIRLVLFKILETEEQSILATDSQLRSLAGLTRKALWQLKKKFISEGENRATVLELLVRTQRGMRSAGKGVPSSYAIGGDLGEWLATEPEYEESYDPATEALEGDETHQEPESAPNPILEPETRPEASEAIRTQAVKRSARDVRLTCVPTSKIRNSPAQGPPKKVELRRQS